MLIYPDVLLVKIVMHGIPVILFRTLVRNSRHGRRGYVKVRDDLDLSPEQH